jgi:hypothetical protein
MLVRDHVALRVEHVHPSHSAPPHRRRLHVQAGTGLAPTPPDKMPAPRFTYSPNARPRPRRGACLARASHSAPPHRRRLHVQAGTGLAPTPPDKMPAPRFRYSPNASPRPCRDACLARAPHSAPPHRRRLHVQAGTGLAPTPPDKLPASRFTYSPNASPRPCRDACLARAAQNAPPHRRRLHVQAGTGLASTRPDKMPAPRFRYNPEC